MLLAIDTSSKACSCALFDNDRLIAENYIETDLTHSKSLLPMIEACLSISGKTIDDIHMVAVSEGPGSYTGLRIGMATAKGIAFPKNLDCCKVSTLLSLAYNLKDSEGTVCAVLDARAGQIFTALFNVKSGIVTRLCPDTAASIDEFKDKIPKGSFFVGDGARMLKERLHEKEAVLPSPALLYQRASSVGLACLSGEGTKCKGNDLVPNYLRLSQAEREKLKKEGK